MAEENKPKKRYESGHPKIVESMQKLVAFDETLDQTRLNPPDDLKIQALRDLLDAAATEQAEVGNARADWRTIALDRATDLEKFAPLASQIIGQLEARGASRETLKDARGYLKKIQGKRASAKPADNPDTPGLDESEKGISASQQSAAALISTMFEFIDFVDAQPESAGITSTGLKPADARAFAESVETKHNLSIVAVTNLTGKRGSRNTLFYLSETSVCDIARRFKSLVRGEYGASSVEFKTVNAIPFKKRKK